MFNNKVYPKMSKINIFMKNDINPKLLNGINIISNIEIKVQ